MAKTDASARLEDRYELGDALGRGGMAEVLAARDRRLDREVAIKLLHRHLAEQRDLRRMFEAEARSAACISHRNVVSIYDTGETEDGIPFIVMERVSGPTLAEMIAQGPMPASRVRELAHGVLDALCVAHDAGIVHRDVKPSNILLTLEGEPKVADFGIAKSVDDDHSTGVLVATAAYVAPERIAGERATPQSDLYSLGVVLYEALAGTKPFIGDNPRAMARAVQQGDPAPLDSDDHQLVDVIRCAMAKDPARRFTSARAMARALEADVTLPVDSTTTATKTLPRPTEPAPPPRRAGRRPPGTARRAPRAKPRRGLLIAAALAIAVLVGALVLPSALSGDDGGTSRRPGAASGSQSTSAVDQPVQPAQLEQRVQDLEDAINR